MRTRGLRPAAAAVSSTASAGRGQRLTPFLDLVERQFLAMRTRSPDLAAALQRAWRDALGGAKGPAVPDPALGEAGQRIVAALEGLAAAHGELPYHDRHHSVEAIRAMGWLCRVACAQGLISREQAALGVAAMVGHDIDHDGTIDFEERNEAAAATEVVRIAAAAGVEQARCIVMSEVILATAPQRREENARRALNPPPPTAERSDWMLRMLTNEADLLASFLPRLGRQLSRALRVEWQLADPVRAAHVASYAGRFDFLTRLPVVSPAAERLRLHTLCAVQIAALARIACDGHGEGAADGAAALDRMDPDAADRRFDAALAEEIALSP